MLFGPHIENLSETNNLNCTLYQIMAGNIEDIKNIKNINDFHQHKKGQSSKFIYDLVVHSSYEINIGKSFDPYATSTIKLLNEIKNTISINAYGIVLHTGKNKDAANGNNNVLQTLLFIGSKYNVKILLETSAGQGSELLSNFNDLLDLFIKIKNEDKDVYNNLYMCIDTCHIFAAGLDISNKKYIDDFFDLIDAKIGINKIGLIHFNDSTNECG